MAANGLLIIGSGPAAVSAANAFRTAGGKGTVQLVTADLDLPYDRPPLSKDFLQGHAEAGDAQTHRPEHYREHDIAIRLAAPVHTLDPAGHLAHLDTGEEIAFDTCILATGARPVRIDVPGADRAEVHVLRSLRDAGGLRDAAAHARRAVVIGSGFIGCEAAASLASRGLDVTLITDEDKPNAARLGEWAAGQIASWLAELGVEMITGDGLARIDDDGVETTSGRRVAADLVLMATGARPQIDLAETAGLLIEDGRIKVDAAMRTSAPDIFAVGDAALAMNVGAGRVIPVEHWGDAMTMGEIAGKVAAGENAKWAAAPGFWSTIGDRTLKYSAWGDGFDDTAVDEHDDGGFTVWYHRADRVVGVLTHEADDDYERGEQLVTDAAAVTSVGLSPEQ